MTVASPTPLVLVVDDVPDIREMLRLRLELAGLKVATAANGREAVDVARTLEPRVVVLDLDMPVMSGLEALPVLREIDASMRIVIHSGSANIDKGGLWGAQRPDAIVPKGSPLPVLIKTIKELTGEGPADESRLELPAIPLQQAIHAFDSWLGLNARIRQADAAETRSQHVEGLDALTKIFFDLGLQMLGAAQSGAADVALTMSLRRGNAESALRALEDIRSSGFDGFYASWGYVPVPEAAEALKDLSGRLAEALVALTELGR